MEILTFHSMIELIEKAPVVELGIEEETKQHRPSSKSKEMDSGKRKAEERSPRYSPMEESTQDNVGDLLGAFDAPPMEESTSHLLVHMHQKLEWEASIVER